jgi:hypothetical protein
MRGHHRFQFASLCGGPNSGAPGYVGLAIEQYVENHVHVNQRGSHLYFFAR